ncbi:MAG: YceI family protein [Bacteroidetes bacterium]|nr:YceI family protein [Bacteroidota bacterium]
MVRQFIISVTVIALMAMSFVVVQNWKIADNSAVTFKIKSMLGAVDGSVGGLKGTILFDPADAQNSKMDVTLDLSTIKTGIDKRDKDIKEETVWFDIAKYPLIAFKSTSITKTATGYLVDGMLTIKGVSKKEQIPFTYTGDGTAGSFTGTLKLNRLDFGVGKESAAVKDDVEVAINVPVKK